MPFTFSHPAIVLPLNYINKRYLSLAGLIAGSIVPDFEYFIQIGEQSKFGHTWPGLFLFDLPVGLLLLFAYFNIVRRPFINHLPLALKRRLWPYKNVDWKETFKKRWLVVVISLLIGAALHILWDGLAHESVQVMDYVPALGDKSNAVTYRNPYYFLIWLANSVVGMLAIGYALWQLPRHEEVPASKHIPDFWIYLLLIAVLFFVVRVLSVDHINRTGIVVTGVASLLFGLFVTSLIYKYGREKV